MNPKVELLKLRLLLLVAELLWKLLLDRREQSRLTLTPAEIDVTEEKFKRIAAGIDNFAHAQE